MGEKLKIDRLFSSHMVLQREKEIRIWGTCDGKGPIMVSFMHYTVEAEIEGNRWSAVLPPVKASEKGQLLLVQSKEEVIQVQDVLVGEVWIAGGQSNMEFYLKYDSDFQNALEKNSEYSAEIRFYDVPEVCYEGQEQDFDYSRMGFWRTCTPNDLKYYSAVGYYFARKLWTELQVPIGIIGCNKGGSCTQTWMSQEALSKHGQIWIDEYEKEIADIDYFAYQEAMRKDPRMNMGNPFADTFTEETLYGIDVKRQEELLGQIREGAKKEITIHYDNRPGCYYEHMLKKIAKVAVRGVIWYQGESEVLHPECYCEIFQDMVECWRELWKEKLPFYCVQLAPFQNWMDCYGTEFPIIRKMQQEAVKKMENAHLISSSDVGMRYDIHPKKKKPIGERLALSALKYEYGKNVQADAPVCEAVYTRGNDLYFHFSGDMDTLKIRGEKLRELKLYAKGFLGKQEISFDEKAVKIEGTTLILCDANVGGNRVSYVSFAQKDYYEVNLYGSNGLPALPFSYEICKD